MTAISAELEGRHYGGGVLELVPSEIEKLYIPLPKKINVEIKALNSVFKRNERVDNILSHQDSILLGALGLPDQQQLDLRIACDKLRRRRQRSTHFVNNV